MKFELELWQLISLLFTLLAVLAGLGKALLAQVERSLDRRFATVEGQATAWQNLEREFLKFQAEMAVQYVRREDYVRGQSVIEAKLDAIASELKRVQIDGAKQGNAR
jgi:Skp family chaperone for outer membrane proteins